MNDILSVWEGTSSSQTPIGGGDTHTCYNWIRLKFLHSKGSGNAKNIALTLSSTNEPPSETFTT